MTSYDDLVRLAAAGESEVVEFKATTGQRSEAGRTLSAMLNARGGVVVFGVGPRGSVAGQQVSDRTLEDVTHACQEIYPRHPPSVERVPVPGESGNELLVVKVPAGTVKPYSYRGRCYVRSGAATVDMPDETQLALVLERVHGVDRWEVAESRRSVEDLDADEILGLRDAAIANQRAPFDTDASVVEVLQALQLVDSNGNPNRAAVVLFGAPDRLGPEYMLGCRMVAVDGSELGEHFRDDALVEGNVFTSLRAAIDFISRHLNRPVRIEGFEAEVRLEVPEPVIREALANAFAHRDYSSPGYVQVRVFDDRLEVLSPGPLHFGLKPADLYTLHSSQPWNPFVLGSMYRRGLVDQLGSGTLRMTRLCADAGLGRPVFVVSASSVACIIPRAGYWVGPDGRPFSANETESEVLRLLSQAPSSRAEVARHVGLGDLAARDVLERLRRAGLVHSEGSGRGARWHLGHD